jgi:hypothetical protein
MGRRRYGFDEQRIARFFAEGRGRGVGPAYHPWFTVSDVPSRGKSHRTYCTKTQREHHLLSDGEHCAFHLLWWEDGVVDIREQYPLPRIETLAIAAQLKVKHPYDRHSGSPLVQTTDFLVTRGVGAFACLEAISVKQDSELRPGRTLDKLEIERQYWLQIGIPWRLILHSDVKTISARNLIWILAGMPDHIGYPLQVRSGSFDRQFLNHLLVMQSTPVAEACLAFDVQHELAAGSALGILRALLARKLISTDLNQRNLQRLPCSAYQPVARDG